MSQQKLEENLRTFYDAVDARLAGLPAEQKQQFLEGAFLALDAYFRFTAVSDLTPLEQEYFMGSAQSDIYSRTHHLKLDPYAHMKPLIDSSLGTAAKLAFAAGLHKILGLSIDFKDELALRNAVLAEQLKTINAVSEELPPGPLLLA